MAESLKPLAKETGITEEELARRKDFLELTPEDEAVLKRLNELAEQYATPVIEDFYRHIMSKDESAAYFRDPRVLDRVKRLQVEYFLRLTQGNYDSSYAENRLRIGAVHEAIDLPVKLYLGSYAFYLRAVTQRLREAYRETPERALDALMSLLKVVFLDIGLAMETYLVRRERTIRQQEEALRELFTPVLQVRPGLLILPIIGPIDSQRAKRLTEQLLKAIRANRARVVVIDITGVPAVDSRVANHLLQTVQASRLMGARAIVTGLSAEVAQTLVSIGVDLGKVNTVGDLQGGIEEAERILGYRVIQDHEARLGQIDKDPG
jgi:rsbT co-antagonist protein RsbR